MQHNISRRGLELIKRFEGYSGAAYLCPANVWTIGWGHTQGVKKGDICTPELAEVYLAHDVEDVERAITKLVKVPLTQEQFDALASFVFNIGTGKFMKSTLLRRLNAGAYDDVPQQLLRWNKAGGKTSAGLAKRRAAEAQMWDTDPAQAMIMPQAVDAPGKPLAKSRTMWGSVTSLVGSGAMVASESATGFGSFIRENQENFTVLGIPVQNLLFLAAAAALIGSLLAIYARWDDKRKGAL